jgi:Ca2+-binding RTX toxin-like protein
MDNQEFTFEEFANYIQSHWNETFDWNSEWPEVDGALMASSTGAAMEAYLKNQSHLISQFSGNTSSLSSVLNNFRASDALISSKPWGALGGPAMSVALSSLSWDASNPEALIKDVTESVIGSLFAFGLGAVGTVALAGLGMPILVAAGIAAIGGGVLGGKLAADVMDVIDEISNSIIIQDFVNTIMDGIVDLDNAIDSILDNLSNLDLSNLINDTLNSLDSISYDLLESLSPAVESAINDLFNWLPTPPVRRDPLTLDLNGDGIQITNLEEGVYFDQDANGIKNLTQWISPEDGFLVLDRNLNGSIDNGTELFGDSTSINAQGDTAANGYDALAVFDINADGKIDQNDTVYNDLQVWIDKNSDGVSQSSELFTLAEVGVASISLTYDANSLTSSYTDTQQVEHTTQSVIFDTSNYYREFVEPLVVTDSIKLLPSMTGTGTVRDLHEAATLSVALENDLASFSTETVRANQMNLAESIVINWAKTSDSYAEYNEFIISPTMDKLYIVESFAGERVPFSFTVGTGGAAAQIPTGLIEESYNNIIKMTYLELASQTTLKPYFDAIKLNFSASGISYDLTDVVTLLSAETVSTDVIAKALDLTSALARFSPSEILPLSQFVADSIFSLPEADLLLLTDVLEFNDIILSTTDGITEVYFESSNLKIIEGDSSVHIDGTSASETLNGTDSADVINGGGGTDMVYGEGGNDTITDYSGNNTLNGDAGDDTLAGRGALNGGTGNDHLTGYYLANNTLNGGDGDDTILLNATDYKSRYYTNNITGGKGDDSITGNYSKDIYHYNLGDGNDVIQEGGHDGNATNYTDKLIFGADITPDMVSFAHSVSGDLLITITDPSNAANNGSIRLVGGYINGTERIEVIEFASDTGSENTLSESAILALAVNVYGTAEDDIISGSSLFDIIHGGEGNDTLSGSGDTLNGDAGNDQLTGYYLANNTLNGGDGDDTILLNATDYKSRYYTNNITGGKGDDSITGNYSKDIYHYNLGDGNDVIQEGGHDGNATNYTDKLIFGADITPDMVSFAHSVSGDLLITITDPSNAANNGSIRLVGGYINGTERIEVIEFASDTSSENTLSESAILAKAVPYVALTESNLSLEVASSQLIQAHSAMGNDGEDATAGEISNNNLPVLPVLDN